MLVPAWRITFVSASCRIRNAARSTLAGSRSSGPAISVRISRPPAAVRVTSSSRLARLGAGARSGGSSGWRSAARTDRSSRSASLLTSLIVLRAVRACSGRSSMRWSPTAACTLMTEMLCASTSCTSRAMRTRSSLARRRSSSRRVRRAATSRSRRTRTTSAETARTTIQPASATVTGGLGAASFPRRCGSNDIAANPIRRAAQATARRPAVAAVKMATATARKTGPRGYPRSQKSSMDASATQSATTGCWRRTTSAAAPVASRAVPVASSVLRSGCVWAARWVARISTMPIASASATSVHRWRSGLAHQSRSRPAVAIIACPSST